MAAPWTGTNRATASAASVSIAAPTGGKSSIVQNRLRQIIVSMVGTANGTDELVVRDGATGAGTIIAAFDLGILANTGMVATLAPLDLRASPGNAITVEFVNGVANVTEAISIAGDLVPQGAQMFSSPS